MLETDTMRTWVEIDESLIPHNLEETRKLIGNTKVMGIVKANAYGHGAVAVASALEKAGVDFFGVATVEEAVELRQAGIEEPILILGYTPPASFSLLHAYELTQSLLSLDYARKLSLWAGEHHCTIHGHVKVDTGMNRTGILFQDHVQHPEELLEIYGLPNLSVDGIFSHFPVSDDLEEESASFTRRQIEWFQKALQIVEEAGYNPGLRHIQNSYGILNYGNLGFDYARPGLLFLGITQDDETPILSNPDFKPVLSWKTRVSLVKEIPAGATVSYGRHFMAKEPRKIASLSVGYADGLPRACSGKNLEFLVRGHRAPVVGNICMDQCMIDVTGIDGVKEGDIVTLVGQDGDEVLTIDAISRKAGTINNETVTRITSRVPRLSGK